MQVDSRTIAGSSGMVSYIYVVESELWVSGIALGLFDVFASN